MCGFLITNKILENDGGEFSGPLKKRGPDGFNYLKFGSFSVYFFRLAVQGKLDIVDQPFQSKCGNYCLTFNGEVYNYRDLSEKFLGKVVGTESDAEILYDLLESFDWDIPKVVGEIQGMFAIAIIDQRLNQVTLVRDCFGQKPIFYQYEEGTLSISSSFTQLSEDPRFSFIEESIKTSIRSGFFDDLLTGSEIISVPPGFMRTLDASRNLLKDESLFRDPKSFFLRSDDNHIVDIDSALLERLASSLDEMLFTRRKIGLFLSGGLDSTLLACIARYELGYTDIECYTCVSDDRSVEFKNARETARELGLPHNIISMPSARVLIERIDHSISDWDLPIFDFGGVPMQLALDAMSSNSVTVGVVGDGADECFGGYPHHYWRQYSFDFGYIGTPLGRLLRCLRGIYVRCNKKRLSSEWESLMQRTAELLERPLYDRRYKLPPDIMMAHLNKYGDIFSVSRAMDASNFLPNMLSRKNDSLGMGKSIEIRSPFLEARVFELAKYATFQNQVNWSSGKMSLRRILARKYGLTAVAIAKKQGFNLGASHLEAMVEVIESDDSALISSMKPWLGVDWYALSSIEKYRVWVFRRWLESR